MGAPRTRFYVFDGSNLIDFLNVKSCPVKKWEVNIACPSLLLPVLHFRTHTHTQKINLYTEDFFVGFENYRLSVRAV